MPANEIAVFVVIVVDYIHVYVCTKRYNDLCLFVSMFSNQQMNMHECFCVNHCECLCMLYMCQNGKFEVIENNNELDEINANPKMKQLTNDVFDRINRKISSTTFKEKNQLR